MNTRRLKAQILLAVIALIGMQRTHPAGTDSSPWVIQRCQAYRGDYCRVPFSVALSEAAALADHKVKVQLRGYLIREDRGFVIYADANSARLGWRSDAIRLDGSKSPEFQRTLERWNQSLVVIRGHLKLETIDNDEYWASFVLDSSATIAGVRGEKIAS